MNGLTETEILAMGIAELWEKLDMLTQAVEEIKRRLFQIDEGES